MPVIINLDELIIFMVQAIFFVGYRRLTGDWLSAYPTPWAVQVLCCGDPGSPSLRLATGQGPPTVVFREGAINNRRASQ